MIPLLAPLAAPIVMNKTKWLIVGGVVLAVILALLGMYAWLRIEQAGRVEAEAKQHEAELARDFYLADSERWQAASREQIKVNAANIAAFEAARADLARSAASAIEAARQAEDLAAASAAQISKLRGKANADPGAVRPVGPLVRDGLEWLRCRSQAGPGADPGACADPD
jgi:biopolymer transport protein ExbB/TolQ